MNRPSWARTLSDTLHRMSEARIRDAKKADCRAIAGLMRVASDGVSDYVWTQLAEGSEDLLDVGERRYQRRGVDFSYENCTIVELDGRVVGMMLAYPIHVRDDVNPDEIDPVLRPYALLEEDGSYYISGVALSKEARGKGIGSQLMELAEYRARSLGLSRLSLIVFEENARALRLYKRLGYEVIAQERVVPHPLIHHTGNVMLMVKTIS